MQKRAKSLERRKERKISEKKELLKDLESVKDLKIISKDHYKKLYIEMKNVSMGYAEKNCVLSDFSMELNRGDRILISGGNGTGKSTIIKAILSAPNVNILGGINRSSQIERNIHVLKQEEFQVASELTISYINQDTSFLKGPLNQYIDETGIEEHLFKAILRQLDFERIQFEKNIEDYSEGQKKKILIANNLLQQAHL